MKQKHILPMMVLAMLLLLLQTGITGCAGHRQPAAEPVKRAMVDVEPYTGHDARAIESEIKRLEATLASDKKKASDHNRAATLLNLAMLHSHRSNPAPDYARAMECMKAYAGLKSCVDTDYVMALLETLSQSDEATEGAKCDRLTENYKKLKADYKHLQKTNRQHLEIIEKLKNLDLQIEERREQIK
ncbi:MAG: hypothetical protein SWH68_16815 [Thermodesulfobacteriota bacterium]|nr:hypothetical protein [Thermodesulfobacteriota bacterium]